MSMSLHALQKPRHLSTAGCTVGAMRVREYRDALLALASAVNIKSEGTGPISGYASHKLSGLLAARDGLQLFVNLGVTSKTNVPLLLGQTASTALRHVAFSQPHDSVALVVPEAEAFRQTLAGIATLATEIAAGLSAAIPDDEPPVSIRLPPIQDIGDFERVLVDLKVIFQQTTYECTGESVIVTGVDTGSAWINLAFVGATVAGVVENGVGGVAAVVLVSKGFAFVIQLINAVAKYRSEMATVRRADDVVRAIKTQSDHASKMNAILENLGTDLALQLAEAIAKGDRAKVALVANGIERLSTLTDRGADVLLRFTDPVSKLPARVSLLAKSKELQQLPAQAEPTADEPKKSE